MRELYRPDNMPEKDKVKFKKDLKEMTKEELREAYSGICMASRAYIHQLTTQFLKNLNKKDRIQMAAKQGIINTMPYEYNEIFLKRVDRLCNMAESNGYVVKFSKWRTTKEYGWFFVRDKDWEDG